jgi:hypothetical protein
MHVWNNKWLKVFLVKPLRLAQVLYDDHLFLIMGMSMPATFEGTMLGEHLC